MYSSLYIHFFHLVPRLAYPEVPVPDRSGFENQKKMALKMGKSPKESVNSNQGGDLYQPQVW